MDKQEDIETHQIKVELLQTDDYSYFQQEEQFNTNKVEIIKIEETALDLGVTKFECNTCDRIFTDQFSLNHHVDENHRDVWKAELQHSTESEELQDESFKNEKAELKLQLPEYQCNDCEKVLSNEFSLTGHIEECHPHYSERNLRTEKGNGNELPKWHQRDCGEQFQEDDSVNVHNSLDNDERPFKCEHRDCSKSFRKYEYLRAHIRLHSDGKPLICKFPGCTKSFRMKNYLRAHMKLHSDEKKFKCDYPECNESFKRKDHYINHKRIHSDGNLFKCEYSACTKLFKSEGEMKVHMEVHSNKKLFKCDHSGCTQLFRREYEMNVHMGVHRVVPEKQ